MLDPRTFGAVGSSPSQRMVKTYLRYAEDASWGVVVSGGGNVAVDASGKLALAPALEAVAIWNIKTGALVRQLRAAGVSSEVTALELAADGDTLAVGYADGSIRLWQLSDTATTEERVTLNGHKSAVSALHFNRAATMLVSGARDTNVIVWDVIAEAGICRLRGHKDAVTDVCLLPTHDAIASVSKDGLLKLWDLPTQHCIQTVAAPSGELWSLAADEAGERLLTGGANAEVLVWRLEVRHLAQARPPLAVGAARVDAAVSGSSVSASGAVTSSGEWRGVQAHQWGVLAIRASQARVARLRFGLDDRALAVQFADRNLQLFSVQSAAQLKRQLKRRAAKKRKAASGAAVAVSGADGVDEDDETEPTLHAADCFLPLTHLRAAQKLHSFAFMPRAGRAQMGAGAGIAAVAPDEADDVDEAGARKAPETARLLVADRSNALGVYGCELKQGGAAALLSSVSAAGHRSEPRGLALSADDRLAVAACDGETKVWNVKSQQCVGSLACGYGLSAAFMLASKYVVVGTKAGSLQAFSLATNDLVDEKADAHAGAVWSLCVQPGSTTILSGGADKTIAFWTPREPKPNVVKLEEERRHELSDDVLCARFTPEGKHVVAALLDASIRILFSDSLKLFLTLYGHQLPVLCVSASSDGELLASGAADKTIKIWGLDFGDCHRSLHGHTESVMCVAFVRETHFFFSSSKDKTVRYWDADHFEQILCLKGHHADVWAMAPSRSGSFVVSASKDRSLRLWKRSDEQVFLEEEREAALEELFEAGLEKRQEYAEAEEEEAAALGIEPQAEAAAAGRRTMETVKGAERVLEALKTLTEESERVAEYENAHAKWTARGAAGEGSKQPVLVPNLLLLGLDQGAYLLKALSSVRATELEQALLLLPFDAAKALLTRLLPLVPRAPPVELMAKVILFLLRVHHKQIVGSAGLLTMLHALDTSLRSRLAQEHGIIGYNLAAMRYMRQQLEQADDTRFFAGALEQSTAAGRDSIGELRRKTAARERGSKREKKLKGRKMKEVAEAEKKKAM